jgi:hypothetical protein
MICYECGRDEARPERGLEWKQIKKTPKEMAAGDEWGNRCSEGKEERKGMKWEFDRRTTMPSFEILGEDSPKDLTTVIRCSLMPHPGAMRIRRTNNKHRENDKEMRYQTIQGRGE